MTSRFTRKRRLYMGDKTWRRLVHLCGPVLLIYFLFPEKLLGIIPRQILPLSVLVIVLAIEVYRLKSKRRFAGLRDYERNRVAAYAWAGIGLALAVLLPFPLPLVVACIIGLSWIDPLIAVLRGLKGSKKKRPLYIYPLVPFIAYFLIALVSLKLLSPLELVYVPVFALVGAITAIGAEYLNLRYIDDDFLMLIVPLLVLTGMWLSLNLP